MDSTSLSIGEVAKEAGVGVETVRFYEREGLVPEPGRRPSGYRQYPPDTVRRIRFVQRAKELGFTLREIRELAVAKLTDVDRKLGELARMRAALASLAASCTGEGPTAECPLLDALDVQGGSDGDR